MSLKKCYTWIHCRFLLLRKHLPMSLALDLNYLDVDFSFMRSLSVVFLIAELICISLRIYLYKNLFKNIANLCRKLHFRPRRL